MASFSLDSDGELQMSSSVPGAITKDCSFTTGTDGTTSATVYFAVLPNNTPADITVSTSNPTGYQISFDNKSFTAGQCYMLNQKDINKQTFTVTVANDITNGTITTNPSSGASVAWGETVTVTATPDTGYELTALKYNDGSDHNITVTGNTGTFTMPKANVTVTTTFAKKSFDITKTDVTVTGGSFKVKKGDDEVTSAQWGETIKVEVTTPQYYAVDEIKVYKTGDTSVPVSVNADGTFTMPTYAVTIEVSFTPDGSAPPTEMPETIGL